MAHHKGSQPCEDELSDAALVISRLLLDTGNRTSLSAVLDRFGFDRAELEAELDADLAAGRD